MPFESTVTTDAAFQAMQEREGIRPVEAVQSETSEQPRVRVIAIHVIGGGDPMLSPIAALMMLLGGKLGDISEPSKTDADKPYDDLANKTRRWGIVGC